MRTLNAKDIERLENTSVASAALAAATAGALVGLDPTCQDASCEGASCQQDSNCVNLSCILSCAISCNNDSACAEVSCVFSGHEAVQGGAPADFIALLRQALK